MIAAPQIAKSPITVDENMLPVMNKKDSRRFTADDRMALRNDFEKSTKLHKERAVLKSSKTAVISEQTEEPNTP